MVGNLVVSVCGQGNSKCDYLSVGTYIPLYFSVMFFFNRYSVLSDLAKYV